MTIQGFCPGGVSEAGFLGPGERLEVVLAADAETLAPLDIDAAALGLALKALLDGYHAALTNVELPFDLDDEARESRIDAALTRAGLTTHQIRISTWRGYQLCPFSGCPFASKMCPHSHTDWTITHLATGETLSGPGLLWHLVADHGFFEGRESPYRVEPEALAALLFG